jgi:pimeloyl-ACP methyl ester carboxylesterase
MNILLWCLLVFFFLVFAAGMAGSFRLTRRSYLTLTRSPAELGLEFEDVSFPATDGLTLRGWFIPGSDKERAVIQLHGHGGSMDPDIQYVPALHAAGFSVLLFDFRAHGRSEGRITTFGYLERRDAAGAVRYLKETRCFKKVALVGFSLGGMVATLTAPICPAVDALVNDGGPARLRTALRGWWIENVLPAWAGSFAIPLVILCTSLRLRANLWRYEPVRWVGRIAPRPLMIIHGDTDQYCPDMDEVITAGKPDTLWRLPGVGHVQASVVFPEEYRLRLVAFLKTALR